MTKLRLDLMGQRFGRLLVIAPALKNKFNHSTWKCRCDCGTETITETQKLRSGHSRSCGCAFKEKIGKVQLRHGACAGQISREYESWSSAIDRCENPKNANYKDYGGRGIKMCPEWRADFAVFLRDMGYRPSPKHSLDRFPDVNGNYEPGNCRWATSAQQARNLRRNIWVTAEDGSRMILKDYAALHGVSYLGLYHRIRIRGMTTKEALIDVRLPQRHGAQILSQQNVEEIRKLYVRRSPEFGGRALAKRFGVAPSTISAVLSGQNWASSTNTVR